MKPYERYVYEVAYDVLEEHSEEYEAWLPTAIEQWITSEKLDGFSSEANVIGESQDVRLRFEFEALADWAEFVESGPHKRSLDRLEAMTERLRTDLWEPTAISLDSQPSSGASTTVRGLRWSG
ncbi:MULTISPECIES: hypothetical protein [Salinibaculum]|uniref:hypothetical protein n=1 Tax=Salinibaculum TaxID=2732368 RepID=UPI0030CC1C13